MKESTTGRGPGTAFARPERESAEAVQEQRRRFVANPLAASMLDAMPGPALVLNSMRQVVAANPTFLAVVGAGDAGAVLARRPGEVLNCIHAAERPGGCGTSTACSACGAVHAFLAAMSTRADVVEEVRIRTSGGPDGGALDFRVKATFLSVDDEELVVVALQDISDEKRRQVLERVFFHDVLNTCGGVHGLAELLLVEVLTAEKERRFKHEVHRLTGALIDEITGHRQMLAAERGRLDVELEDVSSRDLLEDVIGLYGHHQVAAGRGLRCAPREAVPAAHGPGAPAPRARKPGQERARGHTGGRDRHGLLRNRGRRSALRGAQSGRHAGARPVADVPGRSAPRGARAAASGPTA